MFGLTAERGCLGRRLTIDLVSSTFGYLHLGSVLKWACVGNV